MIRSGASCVVVLALLLACNTGGAAEDSPSSGSCRLSNGACTGKAEDCCLGIRGRHIDRARKCVDSVTVIDCETICGDADAAFFCWVAVAADGTRELFAVDELSGGSVHGLEACTPDETKLAGDSHYTSCD